MSLTAIPAQELHWRPIPRAQVREWERARELYEREVRESQPKAFLVKAFKVAPPPIVAAVPIPRLYGRCHCGCGGRPKKQALWMKGHRPLGPKLLSYRAVTEQLARITDPLTRKVLMKELGRA